LGCQKRKAADGLGIPRERRQRDGATLLHGTQNALVILHAGVPVGAVNWMKVTVYLAAALLVILVTFGRLGAKSQVL
jgi:hypothetical protein